MRKKWKMEKGKVSIIVPVYNVEKFIQKCVSSLLTQSYKNIEIILVDDGSLDRSGDIIDEFGSDNRINVIHQQNSGVSKARNVGIAAARGEYVMFVDGDDWVDSDYVLYFVSLINKYNVDIAMNTKNYSSSTKINKSVQSFVENSETVIEWIYNGKIFVAVWNKLYKASILKKYKIQFNEKIWYGEGMLFNIEYLQYVDKVAIGDKCVYHQTFNQESAMRKFNIESNYCGVQSLDLQRNLWKKKTDNIEKAWEYHKYCFNRSIIDGLVRSNMLKDYKKEYQRCIFNLRKEIRIPLNYENSMKKKIAWIGYFFFPYIMAKRRSYKYKKYAK